MASSEGCLALVDSQAVQALEPTSPAICLTDRQRLSIQIRMGALFPQIQDVKVRHDIWTRLSCTDTLIPSFQTLFQGHNVLRRRIRHQYVTNDSRIFVQFIYQQPRLYRRMCAAPQDLFALRESDLLPFFSRVY